MTDLDEEKDRVTCVSDQATQRETELLGAALDAARYRVRQRQAPRADGTYALTDCEECGEPIGEGRLRAAANNTVCIHCATKQEELSRRFAP